MSKFANELYRMMEKAYMEDAEPIQLKFSNRVYRKYGKQFNRKYDFISGKNMDYIAEKLQAQNMTEFDKMASATQSSLLNSLEEYNELERDANVPMMYVPEERRQEWVAANTQKFFLDDEMKRNLLEEYLSSLTEANRRKAIAVMCENTNSKNYYRFLDLSTTAYTPNQEILSNDLINFFHNKYLNEHIDQQATLKRFNSNVFEQQKILDKKATNDDIYNRTVRDRNYFNPYDQNDMLTPKVMGEREFLDGTKQQDQLFEIIDKNSAMYLKQKTQFNNDHLNKDLLRRQQMAEAEMRADLEALKLQNSMKTSMDRPLHVNLNNYDNYQEHELVNPSFVTEMPKFDNIADFIEQRAILNYQNTLRKQHNIATTVNYNNELTGGNVQYDPAANTYVSPNAMYARRAQQAAAAPEGSIPEGEIHSTAMTENLYNNNSVIAAAQQVNAVSTHNVSAAEQFLNSFANTNGKSQAENYAAAKQAEKIQQYTPLSQLSNLSSKGYSMNNLDQNAQTNRVGMVRNFAMHDATASPNATTLNNRYNETNIAGSQFVQQQQIANQQTKGLNTGAQSSRLKDIGSINAFFKKSNAPQVNETNDNLEIYAKVEEDMIKRPRKASARQTTKAKSDNNALTVIKINRGIVASNTAKNKVPTKARAQKEQEKVQVKKAVLV